MVYFLYSITIKLIRVLFLNNPSVSQDFRYCVTQNRETLDIWGEVIYFFSLLMSTFLPALLRAVLHYLATTVRCYVLIPLNFNSPGQDLIDELLRFLSIVTASKYKFRFSLVQEPNLWRLNILLRDLTYCSGLFPFWLWILSLIVWLPLFSFSLFNFVNLPVKSFRGAILKYISWRTSYFLVWLAFHPLPQFIAIFCNRYAYDPRDIGWYPSIWSWQAHQVSGPKSFAFLPFSSLLNLLLSLTCWPIIQKVRHLHDCFRFASFTFFFTQLFFCCSFHLSFTVLFHYHSFTHIYRLKVDFTLTFLPLYSYLYRTYTFFVLSK